MLRDISPVNTNTLFICNTEQHHSTYEGDKTLLSTIHSINKCYYHRLYTTLLWGNWHQQLYHVYPTWSQQSWFEDNVYTYYSFNTLSHPGFGRSHWKTREVSDGRCYGRSYAPSTIVWETWIHKTNYTPTTSIFRSLLRTWWSLSSRRGSSSTRGTQHQISLTLHCSLGNVIKGY